MFTAWRTQHVNNTQLNLQIRYNAYKNPSVRFKKKKNYQPNIHVDSQGTPQINKMLLGKEEQKWFVFSYIKTYCKNIKIKTMWHFYEDTDQ